MYRVLLYFVCYGIKEARRPDDCRGTGFSRPSRSEPDGRAARDDLDGRRTGDDLSVNPLRTLALARADQTGTFRREYV